MPGLRATIALYEELKKELSSELLELTKSATTWINNDYAQPEITKEDEIYTLYIPFLDRLDSLTPEEKEYIIDKLAELDEKYPTEQEEEHKEEGESDSESESEAGDLKDDQDQEQDIHQQPEEEKESDLVKQLPQEEEEEETPISKLALHPGERTPSRQKSAISIQNFSQEEPKQAH